jgi:hypothetical protein
MIKFCKYYVIKQSPSNFSNKTQLKKIKINFFSQIRPGSMHLALDRTGPGPDGTVENDSTVHMNSGVTLHCTKTQQEQDEKHEKIALLELAIKS